MESPTEQAVLLSYRSRGVEPSARVGWLEVAGLVINVGSTLLSIAGSVAAVYFVEFPEVPEYQLQEARSMRGALPILIPLQVLAFVGGVMAATARWQVILCRIGLLSAIGIWIAAFAWLAIQFNVSD